MTMRLLNWISWAAFLISAAAEYGLDIDFPLSPPVWLVIAAVVFLVTAKQVRAYSNCGRSEVALHEMLNVPGITREVYSHDAASRLDQSSQNHSQNAVCASVFFRIAMVSDANLIPDVLPAADAIRLRPEVDRGPPLATVRACVSPTLHQAQRPVPVRCLPSLSVAPPSFHQPPVTPLRSG